MERFEHLGFLIHFGERGQEEVKLSEAAPFFANSDPDMPAVPIPASQVHDWLLENIASALEHISERAPPKENSVHSSSEQDVAMADANANSVKPSTAAMNPAYIEGISKQSLVKQESDLRGSSVKVSFFITITFKAETLYCIDINVFILNVIYGAA